jgi:hypothetical protein
VWVGRWGLEGGAEGGLEGRCTHIPPAPPSKRPAPPRPTLPGQVVNLASFHARHAYGDVPVAPSGGVVVDTQLPVPLVRPPGPLTMLGPRDGNLWLLTAQGGRPCVPPPRPPLPRLAPA